MEYRMEILGQQEKMEIMEEQIENLSNIIHKIKALENYPAEAFKASVLSEIDNLARL